MKKNYTLLTAGLLSVFIFSNPAKTQNQLYWAEGFEPATSSQLLTTAPAVGAAAPYYASLGSGSWYIYGSYRTTGTACANGVYTDGTHSIGANHLRLSKNITPDFSYVVTPQVNYGVKELHFLRSQASRKYDIYITEDTGAVVNGPSNTPTEWILIATTPSSPNTCSDTTILVNSATAKRVKIQQNVSTLDYNIDSVFLTSFSFFDVPVNFTSVNVLPFNRQVKLSWDLQTETNTEQYIIERSADGNYFSAIGTVTAANAARYAWTDIAPLPGASYYRVKAVERGAGFKYSTAVRYLNSKAVAQVMITPNPVKGNHLTVQMNNLEKGNYTINIYNVACQKMFTRSAMHEGGNSSKEITLPSAFSPGIYNVQVTKTTSRFNTLIVIQ